MHAREPLTETEPPTDGPPATTWGLVTSVVSLLTPRERRIFAGLLLLGVLSAGLDVVVVGAVPGLIGGIIGIVPDAQGSALGWLIRTGGELVARSPALTGLGLLLLFVFKNGLLAVHARLGARFAAHAVARASRELFADYMNRSWREQSELSLARAQRDITSETRIFFGEPLNALATLTTHAFALAAVLGAVLVLDAALAVTTALLLLLFASVLLVAARKSDQKHARGRRRGQRDMHRWLHEGFGAWKEIRVAASQRFFIGRFDEASRQWVDAGAHQSFLQRAPRLVVETLAVAGLALGLVASQLLHVEPSAILTLLVAFAAALARLVPGVQSVTASILRLRHCATAVALVPALVKAGSRAVDDEREIPPPERVRLDNVCFGYGRQEPVLRGVDLQLERGKTLALVGRSGAGKTTLADLTLGLLEPDEGSVWFDDGPRPRGRLLGWAYIPQRAYLADDTLRANVAFHGRSEPADDDRIIEALTRAGLGELLRELPDGLDTRLGEHGVLLSGGQAQRVGIARALYLRPAWIVLDEALSAVDSPASQQVFDALLELKPAPGMLVIAHRMSTVRLCDRVAVLSDGRIAAQGTFEELASQGRALESLLSDAPEPAAVDVDRKLLATAQGGEG